MEGSWPIILEGVDCGRVTASRDGAYTVFTAEATYAGELVRISLYGSGREGYLGILAPDGSGDGILRLRRKFTRSELAAFPSAPEYASAAGGVPPSGGDKPEPDKGTGTHTDTASGEPETAPSASGEGPLWYTAPDGTLSRFDGERLLVALPSENVRVPDWASGVVQRINGREYVVFPR